MAALGPVGKDRLQPGGRVCRGASAARWRWGVRAWCLAPALVAGCAETPPPPPVEAPPSYAPGLFAVFPAPARHRDEGSEHHWELCYKGGYYHLMCSSAWSGGLADEVLDSEFQEYGEVISVVIDHAEDFDGRPGRRVRLVGRHRVYDWLFVTTEESTFMMNYQGPNTERSRSHGEFFMRTFHLEPGVECPSVEHAHYDETEPTPSTMTCPGMPADPEHE
jgi:hypothetical protein